MTFTFIVPQIAIALYFGIAIRPKGVRASVPEASPLRGIAPSMRSIIDRECVT